MTALIVIVQHGEKEPLAGDPGLTSRGHRQAEQAAVALAPMGPSSVIASPLLRARQTGEHVAKACGSLLETDARLLERMNLAAGHDVDQFVRDWMRSTEERTYAPPGARSSAATAEDMLAAVNDHAVEDGLVILVGHGGATVDLLRSLMGDNRLEARAPGLVANGVPGGGLTTLERATDGWVVKQIGDVHHIATEDQTGHVISAQSRTS